VLDDVMSALDAHVGKELFEQCIIGTLKDQGKTVLLVTNQLQVLCLFVILYQQVTRH
jgi:ABC-type nitrate/sulfonate/bicarbonate transport system ATPase subunit